MIADEVRHFTLTETIPNPHFDRRCKHDPIRSVSLFRPGTVVQAVRWVNQNGDFVRIEYSIEQRPITLLHDLFAAQDPGFETEPQSIVELAARETSTVETVCRRAVQKLIESGRLTEQDIIKAYEEAFDDADVPSVQ